MPDRRITEAVVLAEDLRSFNLIRRTLLRAGRYRNIRARISPRADGSAEQWVRLQFPTELQAYRSARARRTSALVVHTDADNNAADVRARQLADACVDCGTPAVGDDELVAILVPKWSTETWIIWLTGGGVQVEDETVKQKCDDCEARIAPAAQRIYELTRPGVEPATPIQPSFLASLLEWRKVL